MCSNANLAHELRETRAALKETGKELVDTRIEVAKARQEFATWKDTVCKPNARAIERLQRESADTKAVARTAATRAALLSGLVISAVLTVAGVALRGLF
jgi:chromosome segregation ATPase